MTSLFQINVLYLRKTNGLTQSEAATVLSLKRNTISNYESGHSEPNIETILKIASFYGVSVDKLLNSDLGNANLNEKEGGGKNIQNANLIRNLSANLNHQKAQKSNEIRITVMSEKEQAEGANTSLIPVTDISVAAGSGYYNAAYVENVEYIRLPVQFLKQGAPHICVKIKGVSMAPTLQDGGYVVIRLLDKSEWAEMPDERICVVSDREGKSYLKRVKNRFKQGFIVLRSDSPDQFLFPSFNLTEEEINTIWYVEWLISAKMPNIHDQFYTRLQQLEDRVDELSHKQK